MQAQARGLPTWAWVAIVVVAAVALGATMGVIGGAAGFWLARTPPDAPSLPGSPSRSSVDAPRDPGSVAAIAEAVLPGVVSIAVDAADGSGTGAGFVLREDGYVVTNNHVVAGAADGAGSIDVVLADGRRVPATVVGRNISYDIAVLSIPVDGLTVLDVGDSDRVTVGDTVIAIGAPLGLDGTVTVGIVSALDRPVTTGEDADTSFISAIQTDAAINPGNSGGALIDADGKLLGINTAIYSRSGGSQGIGLAIPADSAAKVLQDIVQHGEVIRGWLGVSVQGMPARVRLGDAEQTGLVVSEVESGSPAAGAGLQPGDLLLTINGEAADEGRSTMLRIGLMAPGDAFSMEVLRGENRLKLDGVVGQRPSH